MTTALLVVDVQPAYDTYCGAIARQVAQRINNTRKPVVVMWVGEGVTTDTEDDVREYLRAHGARPGRLDQAKFVEKSYGFLRAAMDLGANREHIVAVTNALMATPGVHSSEDLDIHALIGDAYWPDDSIYLPSFDARCMQFISKFETCGGGNNECLAEVELWLEAQDKPFKRLDHLVYG